MLHRVQPTNKGNAHNTAIATAIEPGRQVGAGRLLARILPVKWRSLGLAAFCAAVLMLGFADLATGGELIGSKHDLTSLNQRAGVEAMGGLAFNDYKDPCIYCHIPDTVDGLTPGEGEAITITQWNRFLPDSSEFTKYNDTNLIGKPDGPGPESLLCLSCHDGRMAVDMVIEQPEGWSILNEAPLHMKMNKGGGMDNCTRCHDGVTAHMMDNVVIGSDLANDHPVGIDLPFGEDGFFMPKKGGVFKNGVKLFRGRVECPSCHNVHDPDNPPFLRVKAKELCLTCHNK